MRTECTGKEKRPRFSNCFPHDELGIEINRNQGLRNGELNYFPTVVDNCSNTAQHGNNMGADSLLQNNSEWKTSCENEEATGMDVECETDGESCPPNSNIGSTSVVPSDPCSSNESTPVKGSPAREFLSKYRPEYQMYCIPSYCHPGGLWDVMLEVYHGL